ncbi:MAG: hypothetical protein JST59_01415 [Actinobacteria bacterium]|nr:hypothetical protein [Actinomycetota bacterium]
MFYSPTCPHCRETMPHWNDFADAVKFGNVTVPKGLELAVVNW